MMITEKTTIKCEYCYDDEHVQRYYIMKTIRHIRLKNFD